MRIVLFPLVCCDLINYECVSDTLKNPWVNQSELELLMQLVFICANPFMHLENTFKGVVPLLVSFCWTLPIKCTNAAITGYKCMSTIIC